MTVFTQLSYTSAKNCRTASSVAGLTGLLAMLLFDEEDERVEAVVRSGSAPEEEALGSGQCRRRNFAPAPVMKQEI